MLAAINKIAYFSAIARRGFINRFLRPGTDLLYVIENTDWIIAWIGQEIVRRLNKNHLVKGRVIVDCVGARNKIIHFGSENTFMLKNGPKKVHPSNKVVLTWFHVTPGDKRVKDVPKLNQAAALVHTACENTRQKLIGWGLNKEKIVVIPLGVELKLFRPKTKKEKTALRKRLGIAADKITVGSFQKDGVGWGAGNEPKLQKGPDVFCEVVEKLAKKYPIQVVLTGPARGYVKKRLKRAGIPWIHEYCQDFRKLTQYYSVLDLYLMASREEGGPKSVLEAMASGVPVVATKTGMAPDVIEDGVNGLLTEVEKIEDLSKKSSQLIENKNLRTRIIDNALRTVRAYDWKKIAERYQKEIYAKLL